MAIERGEVFSLIEIFGELPVSPDVFKTLDKKLKWLGSPIEGKSFCTSCGTLSPKIPRSHHNKCYSYMDRNEYPEDNKNPLGKCPACGDDFLSITSSRELRQSSIDCHDCGYSFYGPYPEEILIKRFKKEINNA